MTLVLGPIHRGAWPSLPRALILSPRIAMACATGAAAFMVTILPLRRTRSAGWAKAPAAHAAQAVRTRTRIGTRILFPAWGVHGVQMRRVGGAQIACGIACRFQHAPRKQRKSLIL